MNEKSFATKSSSGIQQKKNFIVFSEWPQEQQQQQLKNITQRKETAAAAVKLHFFWEL